MRLFAAFETGSQAREGIGHWLSYYNAERPHSTHGILTPDEVHASKTEPVRLGSVDNHRDAMSAAKGSTRLTSAQLAMLWEGIDWRRPDWGAPPARVG